MIKNKKFIFFILFFIFLCLPFSSADAKDKEDIKKAVVKVCYWNQDIDFFLKQEKCVTGFFISEDGFILTSEEISTKSNSNALNNFPIFSIVSKQDGQVENYIAEVVYQSAEKDMAVFRAYDLDGQPIESPYYLDIPSECNKDTGYDVSIFGYPTFGSSLTENKGSIVSIDESYKGVELLGTDAEVAVGSSGNVAVNEGGTAVGMVNSLRFSDFNTSYLLDLCEVKEKITEIVDQDEQFEEKTNTDMLIDIFQKSKQYNQEKRVFFDFPRVDFQVSEKFDISLEDENTFYLEDEETGARISIAVIRHFCDTQNKPVDTDALSIVSLEYFFADFEDTHNELSRKYGAQSFKIEDDESSYSVNGFFVSVNSFLVTVVYDYGEEDAGKEIVDQAINNFTIDRSVVDFSEDNFGIIRKPFMFDQSNLTGGTLGLDFSGKNKNKWFANILNALPDMNRYYHKDFIDSYVEINTKSISETEEMQTNQEYYDENFKVEELDSFSEGIKDAFMDIFGLDFVEETEDYDLDFNFSNIKGAIKIDSFFRDEADTKIYNKIRQIIIRRDGKEIEIKLNSFLEDENEYKKLLEEFDGFLASLKLKESGQVSGEDSVVDVDSDGEKLEPVYNVNVDKKLSKRLAGKILLNVDDGGSVWYVDKKNNYRHKITWDNALNIFENFSIGISNNDLLKIKTNHLSVADNLDSDADGYPDRLEFENDYSPYNPEPVKFLPDNKTGKRLAGEFLLQVENGGAIWYVDEDGVKNNIRWDNLEYIFQELALGIKNSELEKIQIGSE